MTEYRLYLRNGAPERGFCGTHLTPNVQILRRVEVLGDVITSNVQILRRVKVLGDVDNIQFMKLRRVTVY